MGETGRTGGRDPGSQGAERERDGMEVWPWITIGEWQRSSLSHHSLKDLKKVKAK